MCIRDRDAMDRLSGKPMAALCDLCQGVSKKTSDAVNRALALDYHARYKDIVSFLNDVDSVSYTQLDVYKRQYLRRARIYADTQNRIRRGGKVVL